MCALFAPDNVHLCHCTNLFLAHNLECQNVLWRVWETNEPLCSECHCISAIQGQKVKWLVCCVTSGLLWRRQRSDCHPEDLSFLGLTLDGPRQICLVRVSRSCRGSRTLRDKWTPSGLLLPCVNLCSSDFNAVLSQAWTSGTLVHSTH